MTSVSPHLELSRVAVLGCGFWSRFQIPTWLELPGVRVTMGQRANASRYRPLTYLWIDSNYALLEKTTKPGVGFFPKPIAASGRSVPGAGIAFIKSDVLMANPTYPLLKTRVWTPER